MDTKIEESIETPRNTELTSLNVDELDIEELERRLELSGDMFDAFGGCYMFDCGTYCDMNSGDTKTSVS